MLLYIHGFNSSPASFKASLLKQYVESRHMADCLHIPLLSGVPEKAMAQLSALIEPAITDGKKKTRQQICLIGSSLGGYYATWLAEHYGCRAVLVNPAVRPYDLLENNLGMNVNYYTDEVFELTSEHIEQLRKLEVEHITKPDRYLLMLQTGDEVLDYKLAIEKYPAVPSIVEEGGGHEFMGFDRHLETVLAFCGINCLKKYS
jgi:uncharacterized protein